MPIILLNDSTSFPPVENSDENGIVAIGGDLSTERLLNAYSMGIFPWYSEDEPILWWSPDPRFVLEPGNIKISKSMKQVLSRKTFQITFDKDFTNVIRECQKPRQHQEGTWITGDMMEAYTELHRLGYAHSVEAWKDGELAGGLYGISLGRCFFGESMFTLVSNASKAAFITLAVKLNAAGFKLIDCQVYTNHLKNFGAKSIPRSLFIEIINREVKTESLNGNWGNKQQFM